MSTNTILIGKWKYSLDKDVLWFAKSALRYSKKLRIRKILYCLK